MPSFSSTDRRGDEGRRAVIASPQFGSKIARIMKRIARAIEATIFTSRWMVAPFLLGLIIGLAGVLYEFGVKLVQFLVALTAADHPDVIVGILRLVDLSLVANLVLIVICSSYENFLTPIDPAEHPHWPN